MPRCRQSSFYLEGIKLGRRQARYTDPSGVERWVVPGKARQPDEISVHELPDGVTLTLMLDPALHLAPVTLRFAADAAWGRAGRRALDLDALALRIPPLAFAVLVAQTLERLSSQSPTSCPAAMAPAGLVPEVGLPRRSTPAGDPYLTALADAWFAHSHLLVSNIPARHATWQLALYHSSPEMRRALASEIVGLTTNRLSGVLPRPGRHPDWLQLATSAMDHPAAVMDQLEALLCGADPALRAELIRAIIPSLHRLTSSRGDSAWQLTAPLLASATDPLECAAWRDVLLEVVEHHVAEISGLDRARFFAAIPSPGPVLSRTEHARLVRRLCEHTEAAIANEDGSWPAMPHLQSVGLFAEALPSLVAELSATDRDELLGYLTATPLLAPLLAGALAAGLAPTLSAEQLASTRTSLHAAPPHLIGGWVTRALPPVLAHLTDPADRRAWVLGFLAEPAPALVRPLTTYAYEVLPHLDDPTAQAFVAALTTAGATYHDDDAWQGVYPEDLVASLAHAEVLAAPWVTSTGLAELLCTVVAPGLREVLIVTTAELTTFNALLTPQDMARVVRALDTAPNTVEWSHLVDTLIVYPRLAEHLGDLDQRLDRVLSHPDSDALERLTLLLPQLFDTCSSAQLERVITAAVSHADDRPRRAAAHVSAEVFAELELRRARAEATPPSTR